MCFYILDGIVTESADAKCAVGHVLVISVSSDLGISVSSCPLHYPSALIRVDFCAGHWASPAVVSTGTWYPASGHSQASADYRCACKGDQVCICLSSSKNVK